MHKNAFGCTILAACFSIFFTQQVNCFFIHNLGSLNPLISALSKSSPSLEPYGFCLEELLAAKSAIASFLNEAEVEDETPSSTSLYEKDDDKVVENVSLLSKSGTSKDIASSEGSKSNEFQLYQNNRLALKDKQFQRTLRELQSSSAYANFPTLRVRIFDLQKKYNMLGGPADENQCPVGSYVSATTAYQCNFERTKFSKLALNNIIGAEIIELAMQESNMCHVNQSHMQQTDLKTWLHPQCEPLKEDEKLVTFLDPLGSGKEAEVWRVCISDGRSDNGYKKDIQALKVFRRSFDFPSEENPDIKIPTQSTLWSKAFRSLTESATYVGLIPTSAAVLPNNLLDLSSNGITHLSVDDYGRLSRYTLYVGFGATFPVADSDLGGYVRANSATLTLGRIACIGRQILEILLHVNDLGFVWMDCKPANILMIDGNAMMGDISFMRPEGLIMRGPGIGTPGYRPHESFKKRIVVDEKRAVFALGVTLYWAITQKMPWKEAIIKADALNLTNSVANDWISLLTYSNTIPAVVMTFIGKLLHPNPQKRAKLIEVYNDPFWSFCSL